MSLRPIDPQPAAGRYLMTYYRCSARLFMITLTTSTYDRATVGGRGESTLSVMSVDDFVEVFLDERLIHRLLPLIEYSIMTHSTADTARTTYHYCILRLHTPIPSLDRPQCL